MSLRKLLAEANRRGVTFAPQGRDLRWSGPADGDLDDLIARIRPYQADLHALLTTLDNLLRRGGTYFGWSPQDIDNARQWARRDLEGAVDYLRRETSKIPAKEVRRRRQRA